MPQRAPLYTEFTVAEYLRHCAALRRLPAGRVVAAVEAAMERRGVAHFRKRLIGALSGGYRQRVGLAQAILHEPALAVRELIKEIVAERTVLISTHILPEVEALCDDIMMIERGRIVFDGSMEAFAGVIQPRADYPEDMVFASFAPEGPGSAMPWSASRAAKASGSWSSAMPTS